MKKEDLVKWGLIAVVVLILIAVSSKLFYEIGLRDGKIKYLEENQRIENRQ